MLALFKSLLGFVTPKRIDIPLILLSALLMAALLVPEFVKMNFEFEVAQDRFRNILSFSPLLILGMSIGAGLGTFERRELRQNLWFVVSVVMVLLFCALLLYRENFLFRVPVIHRGLNPPSPGTTYPAWEGWLVCFIGSIGAWALTRSVFVFIEVASRKLKLGSLTRQRLLIGIAVLLFVCLTARNILDQFNVRLGELNWGYSPMLQLTLGVGVMLVGAAFPAWVISKIRGWWALLVSVVYLGTLTGLSASFVTLPMQLLIWVYALCFSCVVVALTSFRYRQPSDMQPKAIWGFGVLTIALLCAIVLWNFSLNGLMFGGSNRIELARQLKTFSTEPGVESEFSIWNPNFRAPGLSMIDSRIKFQPNSDNACLAVFKNSPHQFGFAFDNLRPEIETAHLQNIVKWNASVGDSSITFQQLEDIAANAINLSIVNCQFIEPSESPDSKVLGLSSVGRLYVNQLPAGAMGRMLRHLDLNQFAGFIYVGNQSQLSDEDWSQMIAFSQFFKIDVSLQPPASVIAKAIQQETPSQLFLRGFTKYDREYWNLVVKTHFSIQIRKPASDSDLEKYWDAAFASRGILWAGSVLRQLNVNNNHEAVTTIVERHHWIFEKDEKGNPIGLLMPTGKLSLDQISTWTDLKTLSFDPRWIESLASYDDPAIPFPQDLSVLGDLTNLERLDLPSGLWGEDYGFLAEMPNLEHLQFDVFVDGSKNVSFGFLAINCPNLKSLVLFGMPPKTMALEIAKLPKLESVKLIDIDKTMMKDKQRNQLQETFGDGIALTIVPFETDRPDVPAAFLSHVEKVRELVREKYLSDDGTK